jgi:D-threo-aldose 1-dehydrogenase
MQQTPVVRGWEQANNSRNKDMLAASRAEKDARMTSTAATSALPRRRLGRTDLALSVLGFGSAPIGDLYARLDDATAIAAAETAAALGVTYFDTAPLYGHGLAEHRLGTALRRSGDAPTVVSTKVGRLLVPAPRGRTTPMGYLGGHSFDVVHDYGYDATMRSLEHSLHRLGRPQVDILYIHDADAWTHGSDDGPKRYAQAMEGAYRALDELRRAGVIKAIGIGLNDPDYAARFLSDGDFDCMLLAGRYSLLEQPALDTAFPIAARKGVGIVVGGVFNSGILATGPIKGAKYNYADAPEDVLARVQRIAAVCNRHGVPLATAALQFCLGHPSVTSLVIGAVTPQEVSRNVTSFGVSVPADLWRELKHEGLLEEAVPTPA